jgi:signal transduction histidine kinase
VLKHAGATAIIVQLVRHPDSINITVEDNGVGFDNKPESFPHDGIGLNNIASRVEYLHGTFDIDTGKGKGTTIIINIPYG